MDAVDKLFGVSPSVLALRSQRFALISANLANADTPGYKAMDIDFAQALSQVQQQRESGDSRQTNVRHFSSDAMGMGTEPLYRMPAQPSMDGNTVETDQEHAAFMDNAIRYQASLNFLNGRIKSLLLALRGD
ncbi:MAG: flagellar basal body rod protein FlgB [Halioglobus sp.]